MSDVKPSRLTVSGTRRCERACSRTRHALRKKMTQPVKTLTCRQMEYRCAHGASAGYNYGSLPSCPRAECRARDVDCDGACGYDSSSTEQSDLPHPGLCLFLTSQMFGPYSTDVSGPRKLPSAASIPGGGISMDVISTTGRTRLNHEKTSD